MVSTAHVLFLRSMDNAAADLGFVGYGYITAIDILLCLMSSSL